MEPNATAAKAVEDALATMAVQPRLPPVAPSITPFVQPTGTDALLAERGKTHGDFSVHANITQELKRVMRQQPNWDGLTDTQTEALDMIAHKIGRVLAGNPDHKDHWDDIAGYARLVAQRL